MFKKIIGVVLVVFLTVGFYIALPMIRGYLSLVSNDPTAWESAIVDFETMDHDNPPPQEAVVFVGSSSIRNWETLAEDMAPLSVVQRGFGGAKINDVVYYVDRIVTVYNPKAVVLFAGSNDLIGHANDKTPEEILASYVTFSTIVHSTLPETQIYYIAISPTGRRWEQWPEIQRTNSLIQEYTYLDPRLSFIDTTDVLLNENGLPNEKLFWPDQLHLSQAGYAAWTSVIRPVLHRDLLEAVQPVTRL
ncbi:MAG: GDSL-type esterase/lipase family protein [Chloroflexota bacterium]